MRATQRGVSKLEFVVVVILFAILIGSFASKVRYYQELSEKATVEAVITNIRTGLRLQIANLLIHHQVEEQLKFSKTNPIRFLNGVPANYLGEVAGGSANMHDGVWYFDLNSNELVYRINVADHFESLGKRNEIRWQLLKKESDIELIRLESVNQYSWLDTQI